MTDLMNIVRTQYNKFLSDNREWFLIIQSFMSQFYSIVNNFFQTSFYEYKFLFSLFGLWLIQLRSKELFLYIDTIKDSLSTARIQMIPKEERKMTTEQFNMVSNTIFSTSIESIDKLKNELELYINTLNDAMSSEKATNLKKSLLYIDSNLSHPDYGSIMLNQPLLKRKINELTVIIIKWLEIKYIT
jgi:hypothetical protein